MYNSSFLGEIELWETLDDKLLRLVQRFELSAATYPAQTSVYVIVTISLVGLFCYWIYTRQSKHAFWCVIGLIAIHLAFSFGDDTGHHVYRTVALSEQIRQGQISLLFTDPATGDVYPIFVYYSFLPYLLPVILTLSGLSPVLAFKFAMGLQLAVFAAGLHALLEFPRVDGDKRNTHADFLLAILLASATYVYSLWLVRAALGELWVYSLIPWVVKFSLNPRAMRSLTAVFFLQICAHPVVFLQSIVCEAIVAIGLSNQAPATVVRRGMLASVIALVLAMPFWLPQFLWLNHILGNAALPVRFADTFLSVRELLDPTITRNIGLWIPCAIALMIAASRGRLTWHVWAMISVFVALAALQTEYLRAIAIQIPVLNQSQFVWRLMLPTAFVGFGALLVGWKAAGSMRWSLIPLVLLSTGWMVATQLVYAPGNIVYQSSLSFDTSGYSDANGRFQYFSPANVWGIDLFTPDYSSLPQNCGVVGSNDVESANFNELREGVFPERRFVYVHRGPIGFVRYFSGEVEIEESACRDGLVLGPLESNDIVRASEDRLSRLLQARVVFLVIGLLIILLPVRISQTRPQ